MGQRAKSLRLIQSRQLEWHMHDLPSLCSHEVLIKTISCAISIGSEVPVYRGDSRASRSNEYPKQMGYESYGEVIEVGCDVRRVQVGDRVVAFYGQQDYAICNETGVIPVPKDIEPSIALLAILSCDAAKGVLKLQPNPSDRVVVTGLGTMGLLTTYFLREYANVAHIDAVEPSKERAAVGMAFGVVRCVADASALTPGYRLGFECSSRNKGFHSLQTLMDNNGRVCILSDGNYDEFTLHPDFFGKELNIVGSSDGWNYQEHAQWFFKNATTTPHLSILFEHQVDQDAVIGCFRELAEESIHPLKVLVNY